MNRWVWLCVGVASMVAGQQDDVRLGILAPELGIDPVPGGLAGGSTIPNGCFCLPSHQPCPFSAPAIPLTRRLSTTTRINVNPNSGGPCGLEENLCCSEGAIDPIQLPPTSGTCGTQTILGNPLPVGQANFGEFPWMAVVLDGNNQYVGGGALIAPDWVLTAAHRLPSRRNLRVRLGELDFSVRGDNPRFPEQDLLVDRIVVHPSFVASTLANNVALLHLARPATIAPNVGPVCLPRQGQLFSGATCMVSGFGGDASNPSITFNNRLRAVRLPIVDPFACQNRLRAARPALGAEFQIDQTSFVCAGGEQGNDACSGDGGSPLVCRRREDPGWTVVGLVAWGIGCGQQDVPGVYTNVASYTNFIRQHVRI